MESEEPTIPEFKCIVREIELCGWSRDTEDPFDGGLHLQTARGMFSPPTVTFTCAKSFGLVAIDLSELEVAPRTELYPRFLDFGMETRLLLLACKRLTSASWLLLQSLGRVQLYRLSDECVEFDLTSPRGVSDELLPALLTRAEGKIAHQPPSGGQLESAEALRGWIKHWARRLSGELATPELDCEKFIWKLVVMLQTDRKVNPEIGHRAWGLFCESAHEGWQLGYDSLETQRDLTALMDRFDLTFSTRIFTGDAELHTGWIESLEEGSSLEQLRAELLMQSQVRFEAESVAWMFAKIEREQEGWRREISGLPPVRKRLAHQGWTTIKPLECDIGQFGLTTALKDLERLATHWLEFESFLKRDQASKSDNYSQPDLFLSAPRGVDQDESLVDPVNFIFSSSMRLTNVEIEEEFGAGLVMMLKALDLVQSNGWSFQGIDTIDRLWASFTSD